MYGSVSYGSASYGSGWQGGTSIAPPVEMPFDNYKNFVRVTVPEGYDALATSVTLSSSDIARLPAPPFDLTWWDATNYPDPSLDPNREIVRVTIAPVGNMVSFTRAEQDTTATDKNTVGATYAMISGINEKFFADLAAELALRDARIDALESALKQLRSQRFVAVK